MNGDASRRIISAIFIIVISFIVIYNAVSFYNPDYPDQNIIHFITGGKGHYMMVNGKCYYKVAGKIPIWLYPTIKHMDLTVVFSSGKNYTVIVDKSEIRRTSSGFFIDYIGECPQGDTPSYASIKIDGIYEIPIIGFTPGMILVDTRSRLACTHTYYWNTTNMERISFYTTITSRLVDLAVKSVNVTLSTTAGRNLTVEFTYDNITKAWRPHVNTPALEASLHDNGTLIPVGKTVSLKFTVTVRNLCKNGRVTVVHETIVLVDGQGNTYTVKVPPLEVSRCTCSR